MNYGKGTISTVDRVQFKDGSYDAHMTRPVMMLLPSDDKTYESYYLTLTSQIGALNYGEENYYKIDEEYLEEVGLEKESLIRLDKVHKGPVTKGKKGGIPPRLYKDIIKKLKEYKKTHRDEIYEEIKEKI